MTDLDPPQPLGRGPADRLITVSGTVTPGVEWGCLLLQGYQLVGGPREELQPGARVRVTGRPDPHLLTTAQQGTPLIVQHVEPL